MCSSCLDLVALKFADSISVGLTTLLCAGLTTAFSISVALLFYQERQYVSGIKIAVLMLCSLTILCGIFVMAIHDSVDVGPSHISNHIRLYVFLPSRPTDRTIT